MRHGSPCPSWEPHSAYYSTSYTLAPGLTNYTVLAPNGDAPTEAALASHRYHHHTVVGLTTNRVWVAFSSSGTNEDASGQMVVAASAPKTTGTFANPVLVVPPQSTWVADGEFTTGDRISYPRCMVTYGSALYLAAAIDEWSSGARWGKALVACELKDDGTIGSLFRISSADYAPLSGVATIPYDAGLHSALYSYAKTYGIWGGSQDAATASDWPGFTYQSNEEFAEPTTLALSASGRFLARYWRKIEGANTGWWWKQISTDRGETWSTLVQTDIANAPSAGIVANLSATRSAFITNAQNFGTVRDPLVMVLFDPTTGRALSLYAIRQGISSTPTYAGTNKEGGAAYPGVAADATNVWVSYSLQKETIGVTKIPLSGL